MPRLVRICLKRVLIDAIIVSVCVVFFVILRDLRVSEKFPPKTGSAPSMYPYAMSIFMSPLLSLTTR